MKKTTKRIIAAMTAAATMALGTGIAAVQAADTAHPVIKMPVQTNAPKLDHGYLVGAMVVGENADVMTSEDGGTCLKKADAHILAADGSAISYEDIKAGDVITYLVDPNVPQTLQLPVTYSPAVIVVGGDDVMMKIAVFDEDGLSDDGELVINYDLTTPYYSRTREAAFISGKALVLYNMTTRSIPAQTNPLAIVKLVDDDEAPVVAPVSPIVAPTEDHGYMVGTMTVGENGETIVNEDGSLHLNKPEEVVILAADGKPANYEDIKAGDVITYYVDGNAPMTLQLPVHYTPAVIVVGGEDIMQKIAVFDEEGLSDDGELVINYDLSTPYYSRTREAAFISGKALVLYNMMTMSIPAQTNPIAIVKLIDNEPEVAPQVPDLSGVKNIVIGENIINHIPVTVNGVQMLPVRAVAEALGYEVTWVGETQTVNVGFASFSIENDSYSFARRAPQSLGQAPVLIAIPSEKYATTYVPASFFTEVLDNSMTVDGDTLYITVNNEAMFIPPIAPGEVQIPVGPMVLPLQPGEFEVTFE